MTRAVPELKVDLPPTAVGKDYLGDRFVAPTPGGGYQLSLGGVFGVMASRVEGFEINLLGLTFGIDPFSPALKLPLIGRLGPDRATVVIAKGTCFSARNLCSDIHFLQWLYPCCGPGSNGCHTARFAILGRQIAVNYLARRTVRCA